MNHINYTYYIVVWPRCAWQVWQVLSGIDEDVLELQVSMDNLMAVHVLDAICKLLEDMPCLRHLRRCTGKVATTPCPRPSKNWAGES